MRTAIGRGVARAEPMQRIDPQQEGFYSSNDLDGVR